MHHSFTNETFWNSHHLRNHPPNIALCASVSFALVERIPLFEVKERYSKFNTRHPATSEPQRLPSGD